MTIENMLQARDIIGEEKVIPELDLPLDLRCPNTGTGWGHSPRSSSRVVDQALEFAIAAFEKGPWPHLSSSERADCLRKIATKLRARVDDISLYDAATTGVPISQTKGLAQIVPLVFEKSAEICETHSATKVWGPSEKPVFIKLA